MSLIREIYDRLFLEYMNSLDDPGRDWDDNPAEKSVIYTYFLETRLLPAGLGQKLYVTEDKDERELNKLYSVWNNGGIKKQGRAGITPGMLMAGYNRVISVSPKERDSEKQSYLRLLFEYMCEDPARYRKGHMFSSEGEAGTKMLYISGIRALLELSGKSFAEIDEETILEVRKVFEEMLDKLRTGEPKVLKRALKFSVETLKTITDRVLRASLHETIRGFFKDMGYSISEKDKKADFHKRKVNKTVDLLETCVERMELSISDQSGSERYDPEDCDRLLEIVNHMGKESGFEKGLVPLSISAYGHMLCILGREHFLTDDFSRNKRMLAEKAENDYCYGVILPYYEYDNDPDEKCFALRNEIVTSYNELSTYTDAFIVFEGFEEEAMEVVAGNNHGLFDSAGMPDDMIPEIFGKYFGRNMTRDEEVQRTFSLEKDMLHTKEEEYLWKK